MLMQAIHSTTLCVRAVHRLPSYVCDGLRFPLRLERCKPLPSMQISFVMA
jgi:hypothetical protein